MALAVWVTGWWLAKVCSQPGMLAVGTKAELANTSGKMMTNAASCAVSGSTGLQPDEGEDPGEGEAEQDGEEDRGHRQAANPL